MILRRETMAEAIHSITPSVTRSTRKRWNMQRLPHLLVNQVLRAGVDRWKIMIEGVATSKL